MKLTLMSFLMIAVFAVSCKKETATKTPTEEGTGHSTVSSQKVDQLIKPAQKAEDPQNIAEYMRTYRSLTAEEFRLYSVKKLERDSLDYVAYLMRDGAELSKSQLAAVAATVQEARQLRARVADLAIAEYGTSYNKLSPGQMNELFTRLESEAAGDVGIAACPVVSYPHLAYKTSTSGVKSYYDYYEMTAQGSSDCDYEYRFDGYYTVVSAHNIDSHMLLDSFGGRVLRRLQTFHDGTDTMLLLGRWRVLMHCLHPNNVRIRMRLG